MPNNPAAPEPTPPVVDRADGADGVGTLRVEVVNPRRRRRLDIDPPSDDPEVTVMPLLAVNGRAVEWHDRAVAVRVPTGPNLVEVMDDHVYESRTVDVEAGSESPLWVGIDGMRGIARVLIGPRAYAASARSARFSPGAKAFLAALGITIVLFFAAVAVILALGEGPALAVRSAALAPFAVGVVAFVVLRRRYRKWPNGKPSRVPGVPEPEPVSFAHGAKRTLLIPPGSSTPPAESGLLLRFAPDTAAVRQLAVFIRAVGSSSGMQPYYSNSFVDWLAAPEVSVNGATLPPRWGTWWVPVAPGPCAVRVRLPGFADPRRPGAPPVGPEVRQAIELAVGPGQIQAVDCRYNIVRLAAERLAGDPEAASSWQRALRSLRRLEEVERVASAPSLRLTAERS